jgi:hypothetical protein
MTVMKTETVAQGHHVRPWRYSAFVDLTMSQTRSTPVYRGGSKHEKKKKREENGVVKTSRFGIRNLF